MITDKRTKPFCPRCYDMSSPPKCYCWLNFNSEKWKNFYVGKFVFAILFGVGFVSVARLVMGY